MGRFAKRLLLGICGAAFCLAVATLLFARWWPPVEEGIASLRWPSVPAEIVHASFRSEYNADQAHGMDGEFRDEYTDLLVAYWAAVPGGEPVPLATRRFDAASGVFLQPGPLSGHPHEIQHLLWRGDRLRAHYDPDEPSNAVIVPGPPWASSVLLALPVALLGLVIAFLRWGLARAADPRAGLRFTWPPIFLVGAAILAGLLPSLWVRLFDGMMPWWILPAVYLVSLLGFVAPSLLKYPPFREVGLAMAVAVPLILVSGIVTLTWWDHRATFGTDWSDGELVDRLADDHPAIAEDAAWSVMRRSGPREAVPALEQLLQSRSIEARRAAAVALTRVGPSALPALVSVEAALRDPGNAEIESDLTRTRKHLGSYLWLKQQVEGYRHQLLHDEDGQARNGAAFSLGQIGELAVVALPDLEQAARDPRNKDFAGQMESVITELRAYR